METNKDLKNALYVKIDTSTNTRIEVYNDIFYTEIIIFNSIYYSRPDNTIAVIYDIKYDNEKCDMYYELEFGNNFKNFIYSALTIVLKLYPQIERVRISDFSNKTCHGAHFKNIKYMDFNMYYILFYGEPWFSKLFRARLDPNSDTQTYYNNYLQHINYPNDNFGFGFLAGFLHEYSGEEIATEYITKYNIEELYNQNSSSLYNFFSSLKDAIGDNNKLRELLAPSFHYIMRYIYYSRPNICAIFGGDWFINVDNVDKVSVNYVLTETINENIKYFKSILMWEYNIIVRPN